HDDHVVGEAERGGRAPVGRQRVLAAAQVVGAGGGHEVQRVGPEGADLWPEEVVGQGHGDDLALADEPGGGLDLVRADVVEGPQLVVGSPAAPVGVLGDVVPDDV